MVGCFGEIWFSSTEMSSAKTQGGKWAGDASTNVFYFVSSHQPLPSCLKFKMLHPSSPQASLIDLKWKVFESVNPIHGVEPSHPVITTCSNLFHDNRLVTWHLGRSGLQLWVFFNREEADKIDVSFNGLLKGPYSFNVNNIIVRLFRLNPSPPQKYKMVHGMTVYRVTVCRTCTRLSTNILRGKALM